MKGIYKEYIKPYQRVGIDKLLAFEGKAILADEQGLGKTLQVLGYMLEARTFPALIVCPVSLKENWKEEAKKWIDCDSVYVCEGTKDLFTKVEEAKKYKIVIINYDILLAWVEYLTDNIFFHIVVFDEAHLLKENCRYRVLNPEWKHGVACEGANDRVSATNVLARRIRKKIFITGTPIVNSVADIANFMYWLNPQTLNYHQDFLEHYCEKDFLGNYIGGKNIDELKMILEGVLIRRVKRKVLQELPNKKRIFIPIESEVYKYNINYLMQEMQEARVDRTLFIMPEVVKWIKDFLVSGKKLVVFSNFTEPLEVLEAEFKKNSVRFDGKTSVEQKDLAVKRFQEDPSINLFLGNMQAASVGITLTEASDVFFIDFAHTAKDHLQAEDRVCRIGQKADSVNLYYMYVKNSIDEQMIAQLNAKITLAYQTIEKDDIREEDLFLKPIEEDPESKKERFLKNLKYGSMFAILGLIYFLGWMAIAYITFYTVRPPWLRNN